MNAKEALEKLSSHLGDKLLSSHEFRGEQTAVVALDALFDALKYCHTELNFDLLIDISSIDHETRDPRFEMVYELCRIEDECHLRIKSPVAEDEAVPTAVPLWDTANWHEREVYDMMGIRFADHPDLRRILMWEGYPFYPLRKEFPLAGKPSDMPDVAFTGEAPLEGGPFVTSPSEAGAKSREPRARD